MGRGRGGIRRWQDRLRRALRGHKVEAGPDRGAQRSSGGDGAGSGAGAAAGSSTTVARADTQASLDQVLRQAAEARAPRPSDLD